MESTRRKGFFSRHEVLMVFLIGMCLLMPSIWSETSITGQDEYWLSFRTPMETLEHGGWFTPWVNGEPRLKKPPLLYWAIMLTYKIFGIGPFAARIWGVFSGAALAACACLLYRELFRKSGLLAGLITLGTLTVAIEGRRAMLDLPLALFTAMAVYYALKWGRTGRMRWILISAFSLGLSFLVKGPVGIILFMVAAFSAVWVFKKWQFLMAHWPQVILALVLMMAIILPWPLAMSHLWPEFSKVLNNEVAARGIGALHVGSSFSTLGGAFGLVFPWSLILFAGLVYALRHARHPSGRIDLWLCAWFFGCVVPFFFIRGFARYMTPLIPAACVLCASWLNHGTGTLKKVLLRISMTLLGLVSVLFCLFFIWFKVGVPAAIVSLAAVGLMLWLTYSGKDDRTIAISVGVLLMLLMGVLYPSLKINAMPENLDAIVGSRPVASFDSSQPSMLSIRLKRSAHRIRTSSQADLNQLKTFKGFVFMSVSEAPSFEAHAKKLGVRFDRAGEFKTFFSRQAWIRFARKDATAEDWKEAVKNRTLADLKPTICYYRVGS
ncbi:MAG: glycosyltransferase family 39 protein [Deltaproteobacteria bacterium]|nr:glycosyltransferase family 39 protein [Deltaproteobacteria bacterium]